MNDVRDAIILAGGRGTRMLPASLYAAKETLPLVDTPILNHLIWEACNGGVERIHIVFSTNKYEIFKNIFFDRNRIYGEKDRIDLPPHAMYAIPENIELVLHEQKNPGGVGDAIALAAHGINGAFVVLLGDNLLIDSHIDPVNLGPKNASNACKNMIEKYEETGLPCAGIFKIMNKDIEKYGVVDLENEMVRSIIEKPKYDEIPSNYILCGRYLFPDNTSEVIKKYPLEKYGELQSIAILEHFIRNNGLNGVKFDNFSLYDSGNPVIWLKSQIDHALRRDDMREDLAEWLNHRMNK